MDNHTRDEIIDIENGFIYEGYYDRESLDVLPQEIWANIMIQSDIPDAAHLAQTCKYAREASLQTPLFNNMSKMMLVKEEFDNLRKQHPKLFSPKSGYTYYFSRTVLDILDKTHALMFNIEDFMLKAKDESMSLVLGKKRDNIKEFIQKAKEGSTNPAFHDLLNHINDLNEKDELVYDDPTVKKLTQITNNFIIGSKGQIEKFRYPIYDISLESYGEPKGLGEFIALQELLYKIKVIVNKKASMNQDLNDRLNKYFEANFKTHLFA
jgi:hypothetical protein